MTDVAPSYPPLSPLALTHEALLRHLAFVPEPGTQRQIAEAVGIQRSNLSRDLGKLADAGLVILDPTPRVTPLGVRSLSALGAFRRGQDGPDAPALPDGYAFLRLDQIAPHPLNPRKDFDSASAFWDLKRLRDSIAEDFAGGGRGVRQNLEVRPAGDDGVHFLIAGERRWRAATAAQAAGDLPADYRVLCLVKAVDDEQHLLDALDENLSRRALDPLDEAQAYHHLHHALDMPTAEIAVKVRRSQKHVQAYLKLLTLSDADKARMRLAPDHPDHLSYTAARHQLQEHRPAPPAAPEPERTPAFDPAQSEPPLRTPPATPAPGPLALPAALMMLVEIAHKACFAPFAHAVPGAAPSDLFVETGHEGKLAETVTGLCHEGYLQRTHYAGRRLLKLTGSGQRALRERGLNPFTDGTALYNARQRNGMQHVLIRDLERADKYATDFLNIQSERAAPAATPEREPVTPTPAADPSPPPFTPRSPARVRADEAAWLFQLAEDALPLFDELVEGVFDPALLTHANAVRAALTAARDAALALQKESA